MARYYDVPSPKVDSSFVHYYGVGKLNSKLFGICCAALIASVLSGCTQPQESATNEQDTGALTVRKSPNDDREYRYLVLPNQMRVLLVSDPSTDKAAAALSVYRGSFHEPEARPGESRSDH